LKSRKKEKKLIRKSWKVEFDEIWPTSSLLCVVSRKNKFQANIGQGFEFLLKGEFGLISR
jgi:hypothetical protein